MESVEAGQNSLTNNIMDRVQLQPILWFSSEESRFLRREGFTKFNSPFKQFWIEVLEIQFIFTDEVDMVKFFPEILKFFLFTRMGIFCMKNKFDIYQTFLFNFKVF